MMKQTLEAKIAMEKEKEASRMAELKKLQEERHARAKEAKERKMKEQRVCLSICFFFCFFFFFNILYCHTISLCIILKVEKNQITGKFIRYASNLILMHKNL